MSTWITCTIGDLVTFQRGHDLPKSEMRDGVYPVAGSNGIIGYHDRFTTEAPGVTIGRSGNIGNPFFYDVNFWAHNTTLYVKEFKTCDPKFVFYLLKTLDFSGHNSGSAVPSLNRNLIHPIKVTIPHSIEEQEKIAEILTLFDKKIELNRQMNATLEEMARALFKAWFVDFEPVRANMENRPSESASPAIAKLFPSEFENDIPKGWHIGTLESITTIGRTSVSPNRYAEDFLHYSIPAFDSEKSPVLESGTSIQSNKFLIEENSILVSKLNPKFYRAWTVYKPQIHRGVTSTEFIVYKPRHSKDWSYLNYLLRGDEIISLFRQHVTGTSSSHQRVKPESTLRFPAIVPSDKVSNAFNEIISDTLLKIDQNIQQIITLKELRDSLLPRLISGKITIDEA